jgi:hypothetical protein
MTNPDDLRPNYIGNPCINYPMKYKWNVSYRRLISVSPHEFEFCVQVRRSSYHDVVKVCDITRLADTSGIQSYVINGSKVLFLRRRPQPRPPKGAVGASQCVVCSRHLQDISLYCSLQCKLDSQAGVKNVSLRSMAPYKGVTTMADSRSSGSGSGPETPSHLMALRTLQDLGSDSDSATDSLFQQKRRKGLPRRAPMEWMQYSAFCNAPGHFMFFCYLQDYIWFNKKRHFVIRSSWSLLICLWLSKIWWNSFELTLAWAKIVKRFCLDGFRGQCDLSYITIIPL